MSEPQLKTQRVKLSNGQTKEIKVRSIGAEALAKAEARKAKAKAAKRKAE